MSGRSLVMYGTPAEQNDEWETPQPLYEEYATEFGIDVDLAAAEENRKHPNFLSKADNSLLVDWTQFRAGWLNPPFSESAGGLKRWATKAADEADRGATVVMLIPSKTETEYFQDIVLPRAEDVRFLRGRLAFTNHTKEGYERWRYEGENPVGWVNAKGKLQRRPDPAGFPCAVVVFRSARKRRYQTRVVHYG
jgi:phage N-6-adenine-methyltransferase